MAEFIPEPYRKEDMKCAATFISTSLGLQVTLKSAKSIRNPDTQAFERVPGTGLRVKFIGGAKIIKNKNLFKEIFKSSAFKKGMIRPNPTDPTGFWRQVGVVESKTVEVFVVKQVNPAKLEDIDLKALKADPDARALEQVA